MKLPPFFSVVFIILNFAQCITPEKVLFLLPIASKSHKNVFDPLIETLASRGHEVTVISPLKTSKNPNIKEIVPVDLETLMGHGMKNPFLIRREGKLSFISSINVTNLEVACGAMYTNADVKLLMANVKFDLIIVNGMMNHCAFGLVGHFKCPHIIVTTLPAPASVAAKLGNNFPASFVPEPYLTLSSKMSFLERTLNLLASTAITIMGQYVFIPRMEKFYQKYLPNSPSIGEIEKNTSMLFMNSHFALTFPRPLLPSVIEVGGMHCRPGEPLPKELDEFLSGAEHGFILFSLGSIVKASTMPEETRKVFVNVFSRLKQRVLWKWETEDMPDLPKNVKLSKWVPQQDVLAHKNIRLFMTHGGLLSTLESVYHGVQLIGLPIFADQDLNMGMAENSGYSLTVEILDLTEERLEATLAKALNDHRFQEKATALSKIYRDQPQSALEKAVYWVEYVIRHKGASHIASASRDLNFLQYHSVDVILFLSFIIFITLWLLKLILWNLLICKIILGSLRKQRKSDTNKKLK